MAAIAFVTSYVRTKFVTDDGVSYKSVTLSFPDSEDYDAIELIDADVLETLALVCHLLNFAHKVHTNPEEWLVCDTIFANRVKYIIPTI